MAYVVEQRADRCGVNGGDIPDPRNADAMCVQLAFMNKTKAVPVRSGAATSWLRLTVKPPQAGGIATDLPIAFRVFFVRWSPKLVST